MKIPSWLVRGCGSKRLCVSAIIRPSLTAAGILRSMLVCASSTASLKSWIMKQHFGRLTNKHRSSLLYVAERTTVLTLKPKRWKGCHAHLHSLWWSLHPISSKGSHLSQHVGTHRRETIIPLSGCACGLERQLHSLLELNCSIASNQRDVASGMQIGKGLCSAIAEKQFGGAKSSTSIPNVSMHPWANWPLCSFQES